MHKHANTTDEQYMRRCFALAQLGRPMAKTNPLVGCCIVYQNRIIGEGFHHQFGNDHAEIDAIKNIRKSDLKYLPQATLYVSLAPCNHQGKTPSCAAKIIKLGIPRVMIGMEEINPVAEGGISALRAAGVEVTTGILAQEAKALVQSFECGISHSRPYITLKWAQTADGFIGTESEEVKISSPQSQLKVHDLRRQHNAILVGAGTVLTDNPRLTTRVVPGAHPLRIVIVGQREIPPSSTLLTDEHKTIIFSTKNLPQDSLNANKRVIQLAEIHLPTMLTILYEEFQIGWLLVEGGKNMLNQFIDQDLWDECWRISAPLTLSHGIPAPFVSGSPAYSFAFGSDQFDFFFRKE